MNIKFLVRDLKIEGVQVVTVRLARLLLEQGNQVEIITLHNDIELPDVDDLPISSLNIPKAEKNSPRQLEHFTNWYQNAEFDFLIAPHGECIKLIAQFDDSRLIPFIHNSDEYSYNHRSFFKRFRYRCKLRRKLRGKHVLCVSESIRKFTRKCCGSSIASCDVLYNPFNINQIQQCASRYEFNLNNHEYLLFVGRLEKQKRVDRLLKSFSLIQNKSIKLLILGEGSLEQQLKDQTKLLELEDRVVFKRFDRNPYPIIQAARGLLLTSDHEGLPTVIIESLVLGVPALSVNCPSGPDEILTGDLSRYLINSYDETVIAKHIDEFLQSDHQPDLTQGYCKFGSEQVYRSLRQLMDQWKN